MYTSEGGFRSCPGVFFSDPFISRELERLRLSAGARGIYLASTGTRHSFVSRSATPD